MESGPASLSGPGHVLGSTTGESSAAPSRALADGAFSTEACFHQRGLSASDRTAVAAAASVRAKAASHLSPPTSASASAAAVAAAAAAAAAKGKSEDEAKPMDAETELGDQDTWSPEDFLDPCRRAVEYSLEHHLYDQAVFFAELLSAESPEDEEAAWLLALAHYRRGDLFQVQEVLKSRPNLTPRQRCLLADCLLRSDCAAEVEALLLPPSPLVSCSAHLKRLSLKSPPEEQQATTAGAWAEEDWLENVVGGAHGLFLMGKAKEALEMNDQAIACYGKCVQLCPYMWSAFERLAHLMADKPTTSGCTRQPKPFSSPFGNANPAWANAFACVAGSASAFVATTFAAAAAPSSTSASANADAGRAHESAAAAFASRFLDQEAISVSLNSSASTKYANSGNFPNSSQKVVAGSAAATAATAGLNSDGRCRCWKTRCPCCCSPNVGVGLGAGDGDEVLESPRPACRSAEVSSCERRAREPSPQTPPPPTKRRREAQGQGAAAPSPDSGSTAPRLPILLGTPPDIVRSGNGSPLGCQTASTLNQSPSRLGLLHSPLQFFSGLLSNNTEPMSPARSPLSARRSSQPPQISPKCHRRNSARRRTLSPSLPIAGSASASTVTDIGAGVVLFAGNGRDEEEEKQRFSGSSRLRSAKVLGASACRRRVAGWSDRKTPQDANSELQHPTPSPKREATQDGDRPRFGFVLQKLGAALRAFRNFALEEALDLLQGLPEAMRSTFWAQDLAARCWFELTDFRRAAKCFEAACSTDRGLTAVSTSHFSTALWQLNEKVQLSGLAQRCSGLDRKSPETWCVMGNCFSLQRDHAQAIKCLGRAIQLKPDFVYAYTLSGHEYMATEKFEAAVDMYEQAIALDSRHYNAWWGLGNIYFRREEFASARHHFERAIAINGRNPVLRTSLGAVLQAMQQPEHALSLFLGAEEGHCAAMAFFQKGRTLAALGKLNEAIKAFRSSLALAPREPAVHLELGSAELRRGAAQSAMLHLQRAIDFASVQDPGCQIVLCAQAELAQISSIQSTSMGQPSSRQQPRTGSRNQPAQGRFVRQLF